MGRSENDLSDLTRNSKDGSHEILINKIGTHLKNISSQDARNFNNNIGQLKKLRRKADYENSQVDLDISSNSIFLSKATLLILKKCL